MKGVLDLKIVDLTTLRNQNKFQILNLQNKSQIIKLFSHSFYTITGKYHEQSAILPMSVNLAVLRIAIVVRIPVSGNRKILTILRTSGNQAYTDSTDNK